MPRNLTWISAKSFLLSFQYLGHKSDKHFLDLSLIKLVSQHFPRAPFVRLAINSSFFCQYLGVFFTIFLKNVWVFQGLWCCSILKLWCFYYLKLSAFDIFNKLKCFKKLTFDKNQKFIELEHTCVCLKKVLGSA